MKTDVDNAGHPAGTADVGLLQPALPAFGADGERRQLTVMFCDVVGSTERSVASIRKLSEAYFESSKTHAHLKSRVTTASCFNARATRSWPISAIRPRARTMPNVPSAPHSRLSRTFRHRVKSAASRCESASALPPALWWWPICARGIQSAAGDTLNLAARLQTIAEPDTIIVSDVTRRLASGRFQFDNLWTPSAQGFSDACSLMAGFQAEAL